MFLARRNLRRHGFSASPHFSGGGEEGSRDAPARTGRCDILHQQGLPVYCPPNLIVPRTVLDQRSLRVFFASGLVLFALVVLCYRMTWYPVQASEVAGNYWRASVMFLKVDSLPERLDLQRNGRMMLYSSDGSLRFAGNWRLDERERIVRVDDPKWDRRFRIRSTLTGPRLCMKVSDLPLEIDHHEHDEEVDLVKDDAAGRE